MDPRATLVLGGDAMLGRYVGAMVRDKGPGYPLGPVARLLQRGDLTIVNLECAMTSSTRTWQGAPKAFYFRAPPEAVRGLADAGVSLVSLANNHAMDFSEEGLLETLDLLRASGIASAGAGEDLAQAAEPAVVERKGMRFGMTAYCDHQADFAAGLEQPGINFLDLGDEKEAVARFREDAAKLRVRGVDWPILSLHWGPNMAERPSRAFRRLAHAAVDAGWRILFGHSAHVFQGIELYRGVPIIYAAGDLVDDYQVDPVLRNDLALLFEMEVNRKGLQRLLLRPLLVGWGQVRPAEGETSAWIRKRAEILCDGFGTKLQWDDDESFEVVLDPVGA